ncbi:MAG: M56 family metallopeptidase [Bacteroidales bacterium]
MSLAENITHPLVNALAWSVLHSLWQFCVIALLWWLAMEIAGRSSANVRHRLSLIALMAIPLTFSVTFLRQWTIYSSAKRVVSLQFVEDTALYSSAGGTDFFLVDKTYPAFMEQFEGITPLVFWAYMAGLLLFSLQGILGYYKIHSLRTRGIRPVSKTWGNRIPVIARTAGAIRSIPVLISERVKVPLVIGMIKPVILIPVAMFSSLSPEQVEAILLHEFRHISNKDQYINILQNLVEILFFFHPVSWWISHRLRDERENRIDEWVVSQTGAPLIYAQALVSLESKRSGTLQPVLAATQSKNLLLVRIKNIMTMKTRTLKPGKNLAALAVIMAATLSLAWFDPTKSINSYAYQDSVQQSTYPGVVAPPDLTEETAEPVPAAAALPARSTPQEKTGKVVLHDGTEVKWEALSEADRQQIQEAIREARLAVTEVNREVIEKFNSEAFRQQMAQVQEEVRRALNEADRAVHQELQSEAFRMEMEKAREEIRRAMEEVNNELQSEAFRMEMMEAGEEVRRALEEMNRELNSEEFRLEMDQAGEEIRKAMKEIEQIDWEGFGETMKITMEEVGKGLEHLGPAIEEILKEVLEAMETSEEQREDPVKSRKQEP